MLAAGDRAAFVKRSQDHSVPMFCNPGQLRGRAAPANLAQCETAAKAQVADSYAKLKTDNDKGNGCMEVYLKLGTGSAYSYCQAQLGLRGAIIPRPKARALAACMNKFVDGSSTQPVVTLAAAGASAPTTFKAYGEWAAGQCAGVAPQTIIIEKKAGLPQALEDALARHPLFRTAGTRLYHTAMGFVPEADQPAAEGKIVAQIIRKFAGLLRAASRDEAKAAAEANRTFITGVGAGPAFAAKFVTIPEAKTEGF